MASVKQKPKRKKPEPQGGLGGGTAWRSKIVGHDRVAPDQLVANPLNYRKHPQAQRDALKAAIEEVGFIRSVTVNKRTGNLIDGHERVWQALTSEQPFIDVEYVDLSEDEEKLALATMDPISEMATMDGEILDQLLRDVNTGSEHLQQLLSDMANDAGILEGLTAGEVVEDEVPPPPVDPITKPGDLWILGEHRMLCGDSTSAKDVGRLMDGGRVVISFTSPPYANQRTYTKQGDLSTEYLARFIGAAAKFVDVFAVNLGLARQGGHLDRYWDDYIIAAEAAGLGMLSWNVWSREGLQMSIGQATAMFPIQHEWILVFGKAPVDLIPTVPNKSAGHVGKSTDRDADGKMSKAKTVTIRPRRELGTIISIPPVKANEDHPAQFPVELAASYIAAFPGAVYEPFSGSGTTIIAAEQLGRKCYAMEISPQYCDVAVQRWEKLTGKEAKRA